ncbi:MAG TPA: ABC transporter permease [Candidatus Choladousia intestinipullorum]|nr:ABC transporter permease [Candidatus Choladousia intestinipullorum]
MRVSELLRLVWLNINQNKFKSIMTSIGIVVGAATIVLVMAIGRGGQMDIAEQFAELNAGAIDISYDYAGEEEEGGFSFGGLRQMFGAVFGRGLDRSDAGAAEQRPGEAAGGTMPEAAGEMPGGAAPEDMGEAAGGAMPGETGEMPDGAAPGDTGEAADAAEGAEDGQAEGQTEQAAEDETQAQTSIVDERLNQENIILTQEDVEDIERFVTGITGATISYSTRGTVEGGELTSGQVYTIAGVKDSYAAVSRLTMAEGYFITVDADKAKEKVCVLGASAAQEIFGSTQEAAGSELYIDDRAYTVIGVLEQTGTVSAGISPDTAVFIPYETGIKYITGESVSPVITVVAEDVQSLQDVIDDAETVLEENYSTAEFTFEDSGSKMEAAESSNAILTMLLSAMAAIVFIVGGIGIMNVLFVSVKERTNEIGILKAIGTSRFIILTEFLIESAAISLIGGVIGVALSLVIAPVAGHYDIRTEVSAAACLTALGFAVLTGTLFGIYPAWKASRLEPVEALNEE